MRASDGELDLGTLLRRFRHRQALTLEQLAELSGVSLRTISDVERGVRTQPHRHTVLALSRALGLDPDEHHQLAQRAQRSRGMTAFRTVASHVPPRLPPDFQGRSREITRAQHALLGAGAPVVAVTGVPGIGKTHMAAAVISSVEDQFDAAVFLTMRDSEGSPLHPTAAATRVLQAVTAPTAAKTETGTGTLARYQEVLARKRLLLCFDDVDSEAQVRELLPIRGRSAMLLTSRGALAGLDGLARVPLGALQPKAAEALLRDIIPSPQRTDSDISRLAELCLHIPLIIRIAGNHVAAVPESTAHSLLDRLGRQAEHGLASLVAGDRSVLGVYRLAFARLSDDQRLILRRLGLAAGTPTTVQVTASLAGTEERRTRAVLAELAELSVLTFAADDSIALRAGAAAFAQLESESDPGSPRARERTDQYLVHHARAAGSWFRIFASASDRPHTDAPPFATLNDAATWLRRERVEWTTAVRHAFDRGEHDSVVSTVSDLHWFTRLWPFDHAWEGLYDLGARSAQLLGDRVQFVLNRSEVAWFRLTHQRGLEQAFTAMRDADTVATRLGIPQLDAWNHFMLARLTIVTGNHHAGAEHCRKAITIFEAAADAEGLAYALPLLAELLTLNGEHSEALRLLQNVTEHPQLLNELPSHVQALARANIARILARALLDLGRVDESIAVATETLDHPSLLTEHPVLQSLRSTRGAAYRRRGDIAANTQDRGAMHDLLVSAPLTGTPRRGNKVSHSSCPHCRDETTDGPVPHALRLPARE